MTVGASPDVAPSVPRAGSGWKATRTWTLTVLTVVAFLSALDRQAFAVLIVPIQRDLQVSDAAMGFMTGSAFAIANAIFGLPLARIADRANRRNLLAVALAVWSIATAISGLAGGFVTLLIARLVVGAAEAAQSPTSISMVSDLFGKERRGVGFMFGAIGTVLGFAVGSYAAGLLAERYSWNVALLVVGLPGLIVAAILFLTVPEPARTGVRPTERREGARESLLQQVRRCFAIPTLPPFILAAIFLQAGYSGWLIWFPAFLMRVHGLSTSQMGAVFSVIIFCGVLSAMWGGPVSDRIARRGARWRLHFLAVVTAISIPLLVASTLAPTLRTMLVCIVGFGLLSGCLNFIMTAVYSCLSPPRMRAFVSALFYLTTYLFGAATAPILFGVVNDALVPTFGAPALRYTLLLSPALLAVAVVFFWISSRTADEDTAAAERAVEPAT